MLPGTARAAHVACFRLEPSACFRPVATADFASAWHPDATWQAARLANFGRVTEGVENDENVVDDGFTWLGWKSLNALKVFNGDGKIDKVWPALCSALPCSRRTPQPPYRFVLHLACHLGGAPDKGKPFGNQWGRSIWKLLFGIRRDDLGDLVKLFGLMPNGF